MMNDNCIDCNGTGLSGGLQCIMCHGTGDNEMITLTEAMLHFIEPAAYEAMKHIGISRVMIFNQACRVAFVHNDQSDYANALRDFSVYLDNNGILPETLED